jgi:transposase
MSGTIQVLPSPSWTLTDDRWDRIAALLSCQTGRVGRPPTDQRTVVAGMLWVVRTGSSWRDLPAHFGPWQTIHGRYQRWRKDGLWQQIITILEQELT